MNIKEIFEKSESGSLTYEQFEAISNSNGLKFADLSEGKYVSKAKYEDDLNGKESSITKLNETIAQREKDLADLQTQLKNAGTDTSKLAELQSNFDSLQNKYTADTQAYKQQLEAQKYEFAVREYANDKKFSSNAAKRDFTNALIGANLTMSGDKIIGADDFVAEYSKDNADAFVVEKAPEQSKTPTPTTPKPQFVAPTSAQAQVPNGKSLFNFNFTPIRPIKPE